MNLKSNSFTLVEIGVQKNYFFKFGKKSEFFQVGVCCPAFHILLFLRMHKNIFLRSHFIHFKLHTFCSYCFFVHLLLLFFQSILSP